MTRYEILTPPPPQHSLSYSNPERNLGEQVKHTQNAQRLAIVNDRLPNGVWVRVAEGSDSRTLCPDLNTLSRDAAGLLTVNPRGSQTAAGCVSQEHGGGKSQVACVAPVTNPTTPPGSRTPDPDSDLTAEGIRQKVKKKVLKKSKELNRAAAYKGNVFLSRSERREHSGDI